MDRLSLEPGHWYAVELLGEEFGSKIRSYSPVRGLPAYDFLAVPSILASATRRLEIEGEILAASPEVLVTLGDQPLKWFTQHCGSQSTLGLYGKTPETYGWLNDLEIAGSAMKLLPLVHPRQAGRLGSHSAMWSELHLHWAADVAPCLLGPAPTKRAHPTSGVVTYHGQRRG